MRDHRLWLVAPLVASVALVACSSNVGSTGSNTDPNSDSDGAAGTSADGAVGIASPSGAQLPHDGAADGSRDGQSAAGTAPAGKAGADAFCAHLCDHEQGCATVLDAAPGALASCQANCQSVNEASTANPPTELLRADYVSALGACIANSSCSTPIQTSEANCGAAAVSGDGDGGTPGIVPTQAVAIFCHAFETSPCVGAEAGAGDCVSAMMVYSDQTLDAALACFSDSSCTAVASCYAAAFTQP